MNKLKRNIIIDILMLLAMAIVSISGYLLDEVCRRGVTFLGMGRRVWIDIHLWSGIVLLALLILHIVLHWQMVDGFFKKSIPSCGLRYLVYFLLAVVVLATFVPCFFAF